MAEQSGTERRGNGTPGGQRAAGRPRWRLNRTVVLVGLMGAGKTSVGTRLADTLGAPFRDSDAAIEEAAAMPIAEIFRLHGEPYFRAGERRVIARLLDAPPHVLATGGGAFLDPETRALIAERAVSVWLRADLETLVARTAGRSHRPLLNRGDPRETLARLIEARYPVYARAAVVVDSLLGQPHEAMVERLVAALATQPGALSTLGDIG
ncbi:MAG: shikimate kinase [Pseudomonadota bacterium]